VKISEKPTITVCCFQYLTVRLSAYLIGRYHMLIVLRQDRTQSIPIALHPTLLQSTSLMTTNAILHPKMQYDESNLDELMKALTDNFNILADEVQLLSDRKTILENKLRFAHEQVRYLNSP
jgi:hypothetical protein